MPGFPPGACELRFGTTRTVALMCLDPRGCRCPAPLNRTSALGLYPVDSHGNRKNQTGALHVASASNSHQRSSAGLQAAERGPAPLKPPRLSRALQGKAKCPPGAEPAARTPVPRRQMRLRLQPQPWHYTGSTQGDVSHDDRPPGAAKSPAEACVQLQDRGGGGGWGVLSRCPALLSWRAQELRVSSGQSVQVEFLTLTLYPTLPCSRGAGASLSDQCPIHLTQPRAPKTDHRSPTCNSLSVGRGSLLCHSLAQTNASFATGIRKAVN